MKMEMSNVIEWLEQRAEVVMFNREKGVVSVYFKDEKGAPHQVEGESLADCFQKAQGEDDAGAE